MDHFLRSSLKRARTVYVQYPPSKLVMTEETAGGDLSFREKKLLSEMLLYQSTHPVCHSAQPCTIPRRESDP